MLAGQYLEVPLRLAPSLLCAIGLGLAGCSDPVTVTDGTLSASHVTGTIRLRSTATSPAHYFLVERELAARSNWQVCADPSCPAVPPQGTLSVPVSKVAGVTSGSAHVILYWWHVSAQVGGGFSYDSVRSLLIPL